MKKKTIIILLILTLSIYALNINVQSVVTENNYRPTSIELTPHDPISITSDGNFTDYSFQGTGTEVDPYIIEGYNITTTEYYGILISGTTKYFIVRNCYVDAGSYGIYISNVADGTATVINNTCNNNDYGIYLYYSVLSTVANNTCSDNSYEGIWLDYSGSSTVTNNTCTNNNWDGILLEDSVLSTVTNNTCNDNSYDNGCGIALWSSGGSTVINNTCNNNDYGIIVFFSSSSTVFNNMCNNNSLVGIMLSTCDSSIVTINTCSNNYYNGIYLDDSAFCVITYNLIQENGEEYGVQLESSDNNRIHHNTFVDNNPGGTSQAYDEGINNYWYDTETSEGNFWSDWSGTGSYSIAGSADSFDLYPLEEPVVNEYPQIVLLTLLLSIVTLFLTRIISKKVKKN